MQLGRNNHCVVYIYPDNQTKFSPEDVLDLIVSGEETTRFKVTLVGVTGLPDTGKTTLIKKLIPSTAGQSKETLKGFATFEVGFFTTSQSAPQWEEFKKRDVYTFMLARALAEKARGEKPPELEEWSDDKLPRRCLSSPYLRDHFKAMYVNTRKELLELSRDESELLRQKSLVLLNVWDVGVNKSLYLALPLLARLTKPLILLVLLDLSRDSGKSLRHPPDLKETHRQEDVVMGRSRAHYYVRIAGLCPTEGASIPIATHRDQVPAMDLPKVQKYVEAAINAKASDVGVQSSLHPEMLAIDVHNPDDCMNVKNCLQHLVNKEYKFEEDLSLNWIFLRTALINYGSETDFRMSRADFDAIAKQCGLKTDQEIKECLKFFTRVGSLLYHSFYFNENVIYRPYIFFRRINFLYKPPDKRGDHARESLVKGFLCKALAKDLWGDEDGEFFWQLLQDTGVATLTSESTGHDAYDFNIKCPYDACNEEVCLFIPSIRKKRFNRREIKPDSLFVTFSSEYVPGNIQALFVKHIATPSHLPGVKLKKTEYYNSTEFEMPESKGCFQVVVHGDVVEIIIDAKIRDSIQTMSVLKTVCVAMHDFGLRYFYGFEYQLGFMCPNSKIVENTPPNRNDITYLHFLPSQYETQLFCRKCNKMIELTEGQQRWMRAPLMVCALQGGNKGQYRTISVIHYKKAPTLIL